MSSTRIRMKLNQYTKEFIAQNQEILIIFVRIRKKRRISNLIICINKIENGGRIQNRIRNRRGFEMFSLTSSSIQDSPFNEIGFARL